MDALTHFTVQPSPSPTLLSKHTANEFEAILTELFKPCNLDQVTKNDVTHHITTSGPPAYICYRQLAPDRLKVAKQEFDSMMELGIVHSLSSNRSSPLHLVPKKSGDAHVGTKEH